MSLNSVRNSKQESSAIKPSVCTSSPDAAAVIVSSSKNLVKKSAECLQESVRARFEPWELCLIKEKALQEYNLLKNSTERRDLEREEKLAREEVMADATAYFAALAAWRSESGGSLLDKKSLRLLQERLQWRAGVQAGAVAAHEAALREAGREAWRREREAAARAEQQRREVAAWRRECEASVRAAAAFLMGCETRERRGVEAEAAAAWVALGVEAQQAHAEAERIAYENFMNSPEQVALREERERKEAAAKRAAGRQMKRFLKEQELFIKSCRHGRSNSSMFEGPSAKKICVNCGIKFDESLGYYVRVRGSTIAPPAPLNTNITTTTTTTIPSTNNKKNSTTIIKQNSKNIVEEKKEGKMTQDSALSLPPISQKTKEEKLGQRSQSIGTRDVVKRTSRVK